MNRALGIAAIAAFGIASGAATPASASSDSIETAGTAIAVGIPVTAAGISLFKSDYDGILQLSVSTLSAVGISYGLKQVVHEERPDHSDFHSFPSETTSGAFAGAAYLQRRYGWDYGLPAYALAAFVGYSRVESKQHHWWDVAAGAAIGWGCAALFTDRYSRVAVTASAGYGGHPLGFGIYMTW